MHACMVMTKLSAPRDETQPFTARNRLANHVAMPRMELPTDGWLNLCQTLGHHRKTLGKPQENGALIASYGICPLVTISKPLSTIMNQYEPL